jgi:hypothetical protein
VAEAGPLLSVVDDAQWLDQASALTLAFVARRLLAEPVGLVFAAREPGPELQHVAGLEVRGLRNGDARALLRSAVRFKLDERVLDRIIAETRGNPLALLELPRGLTATQLAGGFGLPEAQALTDGSRRASCYREAIERLGRTRLRPELARVHLLYGEWLRRENRRVDAGVQLRAAHNQFTSIGTKAFAKRARKRASGHRRESPKADRRDTRRSDRAAASDRAAHPPWALEPGDRCAALSEPADRGVAPTQTCSASSGSARAGSWRTRFASPTRSLRRPD